MKRLNCGSATTAIVLDVRAIFDIVWHRGIIFKLIDYGDPPLMCKVFQSLLAERSILVGHNGVLSQRKYISAGVALK